MRRPRLKTYEVAKFEATAATRRFALKAREAVLQFHLARRGTYFSHLC